MSKTTRFLKLSSAALLVVVSLLTFSFSAVQWDLAKAEKVAEHVTHERLAASVTSVGKECYQRNDAFAAGERVVYKLYYNLNFIWVPAGEVEFKIEDKGTQYRLSAVGTTYSSYEWFFKVRDRYESYIDKETMLPSLSIRDIKEGNYALYERVEFDQRNRRGKTYRGHSKEEAMQKPSTYRSTDCLHDVLSSIYSMRNFSLAEAKANSKIPISVMMSQQVYPLNVRFVGVESDKKIKGLGRLQAYELAPEIIAGEVFNEGSEMRVWASTEPSHVPLLIESPVSVGSVKAVLKSHHKLRYPLPVQ